MKIPTLYFCSMLIGAVWGSTIVKHPTDTTGTIDGVAKFVCEVDFGEHIPTMTWLFNNLIIYFYMDNQVDYPVGTNKYVVSNYHTIFTLEVRNLDYTDGGNYICKVLDQEKSAALIVLGTPVITHEPSNFTDGTKATYICEARLEGPSIHTISPEYRPEMKLFLDDVILHAKSNPKNANSMRKVYEILLDDSIDTNILKCEIGATESMQKLTSSTSVKVLYSVRDITYEPQEEKYVFKSNITCSARGNPIPLFEWRNLANSEMVTKGQLLQITNDMGGKNSWTCTARNSVGGKMYEDEVTAKFEAVSIILPDEANLKPVFFLIGFGCFGVGIIGILVYQKGRTIISKFKKRNLTAKFYGAIVAAIFGSSFQDGWNLGVLNIPQMFIKKFINESFTDHFEFHPTSVQFEWLWALCVSAYSLSGCFGVFAAGKLADKLGRQHAMLFFQPFGIIAAILFGCCKMAHSFEMLIVGRLIIGIGCGAGSRLILMYLCDIAPDDIQNEVLMLDWFAITFGILLSQIAGLQHCLGTESLWPHLLSLTALPSVVSFLILVWFPQWPSDILIKHANAQNKKGTEKVVAECDSQKTQQEKVDRPSAKVNDEKIDADSPDARLVEKARKAYDTFSRDGKFETFCKEYTSMKKVSERELFKPEWKPLTPCLILLFGLNICQQLSGIHIVFYYSLSVFEDSGVPQDIIEYCVLSTGVINVLTTGVSIVGDFKLKHVLIIGMMIMILSSLLMTLALHLQIFQISIISINTFVLGFALGFGSVTSYIGRDLFFAGPRTPAITIAYVCNWFGDFLVALGYPILYLKAGPNSFLPFTGILVISTIWFFVKLPETKDKTLKEVYKKLRINIDENWPIEDETALPKTEHKFMVEIYNKIGKHWPIDAETEVPKTENRIILEIYDKLGIAIGKYETEQPKEETMQPEEVPMLEINEHHQPEEDTNQLEENPLQKNNEHHQPEEDTNQLEENPLLKNNEPHQPEEETIQLEKMPMLEKNEHQENSDTNTTEV